MTDTFDAYDETGNRYTVHLIRSFNSGRYLDGSTYRTEGLKSYCLTNGQPLNKIDEEIFEIFSSGQLIKTRPQTTT